MSFKIWVAPTPSVNISLYNGQGVGGVGIGYAVYWSTSTCSGWDVWPMNRDCPNTSGCTYDGFITVYANTTVYIAVRDCDGNFISFNAADNTSSCPSNSITYCHDYDTCTGTPFSFNSGTSNKNIAVTVFTGKLGYVICV